MRIGNMGEMIIYDHTNSPIWSKAYKEKYAQRNKTNGAYTYSVEIVKHHIPTIEKVLKQYPKVNAMIMTVGYSYNVTDFNKTNLIISYLHEKLSRDIERVNECVKLPYKHIFITGRTNVKQELEKRDIPCIWLPMSIDKDYVLKQNKSEVKYNNRVIFFGNKYAGKRNTFLQWKKFFNERGICLDSICDNVYAKECGERIKLNREQLLGIISNYKYGIGVGRCVLEMYALGLKVLISGKEFCGIIMTQEDFDKQSRNNFTVGNGFTFSDDFQKCWENIDNSLSLTTGTNDVLPILEKELKKILDKK